MILEFTAETEDEIATGLREGIATVQNGQAEGLIGEGMLKEMAKSIAANRHGILWAHGDGRGTKTTSVRVAWYGFRNRKVVRAVIRRQAPKYDWDVEALNIKTNDPARAYRLTLPKRYARLRDLIRKRALKRYGIPENDVPEGAECLGKKNGIYLFEEKRKDGRWKHLITPVGAFVRMPVGHADFRKILRYAGVTEKSVRDGRGLARAALRAFFPQAMRAEDTADWACTARIRFGDVVEIEARSKKRVYFGTANFPAFVPAKTLEREITVPLSKQTLKNIARSVYFRVRIEKTMERLGLPPYRFDPEERIVDFRADRKARIAVFILDEAFGYRVRLFSPNGEKTFVSTTPNIDIREAIARAFDVHLPKDRIPDWEELETIIAMRALAGRT